MPETAEIFLSDPSAIEKVVEGFEGKVYIQSVGGAYFKLPPRWWAHDGFEIQVWDPIERRIFKPVVECKFDPPRVGWLGMVWFEPRYDEVELDIMIELLQFARNVLHRNATS